MASTLATEPDYKNKAVTFSEMNKILEETGEKFVLQLGVKHGEKVLDMGCGTGEIAALIADLVGEEGEVVGVDPDQERIKVAIEKHGGVKRNILFKPGDSNFNFPHFNQEYYDIHYSNFVFHLLPAQEKEIFLKTAFNCLKPGGRIALQTTEKNHDAFNEVAELLPDDEIESNRLPVHFVEKSITESLLKNSGFEILLSEYVKCDFTFPDLDYFLKFYSVVTGLLDENKILPHKKEAYARKFVNEDGGVYLYTKAYLIIAQKLNSK